MMKWTYLFALPVFTAFIACAGQNPPHDLRQEIFDHITLREVKAAPNAYKGRSVLWGGVIANTTNKEDGTEIEVVQMPLGHWDRPVHADRSAGRFLVTTPEFLDAMIYDKGRKLTVVGEIEALREGTVGDSPHRFPVLAAGKMHLWPREYPVIYIYRDRPYFDDGYWQDRYWHDRYRYHRYRPPRYYRHHYRHQEH